jgi:hypothetical protein
MNTKILRVILHELCVLHRFDEEDAYRRAARLVREEDLFLEQPYPPDKSTPIRRVLQLGKRILRLDYKRFAATEPELACWCPGWWEVASQKKYVELKREQRKKDKEAQLSESTAKHSVLQQSEPED